MPRRKPGTLLALETEILEVALTVRRSGSDTFHGFGLAQTMREQRASRSTSALGRFLISCGAMVTLRSTSMF